MIYKPKIHELFNNTILNITLPNKKELLLNIFDLKCKDLIFVNNKGFNGGRLIILNIIASAKIL